DDVADEDVRLLNARRVGARRDAQRDVGRRGEVTAGAARQPHHRDAARAARVYGLQHARRAAARRDRERDVAALAERLDLANEHLLVAVVVGDGRQRRRVGGERDGRDGGPILLQTADELGGDVL